MKDKLKDKKVKCRICNGEHFTARCPFKDTMAPVGEESAAADVAAGAGDTPEGPGGLGAVKGSYVPPHMRNGGGASAAGDRMGGGKFERDDLATLRVTNVSEAVSVTLLLYANIIKGFRNGRRARTPGHVRAIWTCHKSLPGKG